MDRQWTLMALFPVLMLATPVDQAREPSNEPSRVSQEARDERERVVLTATVRRVFASRVFSVETEMVADSELIVLAPNGAAAPPPGTTVLAGGVLSELDGTELAGTRGWNEIDERTRLSLVGRPLLIATSVSTAPGHRLIVGAKLVEARRPARQARLERRPDPMEATLHASALAVLIDELGGRRVTLPKARVLVVLNPRAFLIESASVLPGTFGNLDRLLVLIDAGELRVGAAAIVDTNVTVLGVARTLLGIQVTGEVPWPEQLTRDVVKRFEIRGAVLARSVQTADGVELTVRHAPSF